MGTDLSPYFSLQSRKASSESHVKVGKFGPSLIVIAKGFK
jgi:hypothetical protein